MCAVDCPADNMYEPCVYCCVSVEQELAEVGGEADLEELLASRRAARATAQQ